MGLCPLNLVPSPPSCLPKASLLLSSRPLTGQYSTRHFRAKQEAEVSERQLPKNFRRSAASSSTGKLLDLSLVPHIPLRIYHPGHLLKTSETFFKGHLNHTPIERWSPLQDGLVLNTAAADRARGPPPHSRGANTVRAGRAEAGGMARRPLRHRRGQGRGIVRWR